MTSELSKFYYYQNPVTNQPSSNPVSTSQICKLLCPINTSSSPLLLPTSLVIAYDPESNEYDQDGWKAATGLPVLREASSLWYYEDSSEVIGPISCRELARKMNDLEGSVSVQTRVWSPQLSNIEKDWRCIVEFQNLLAALEVFRDDPASLVDFSKTVTSNSDEGQGTKSNAPKDDESDGLDAFFSSTENDENFIQNENKEEYESDGGTQYFKDDQGNWMNANDAPPRKRKVEQKDPKAQVKHMNITSEVAIKLKKPNFKSKNSKCWIYVTGLPSDTDGTEVAKFFSRAGILDLDPETQKPKIKLYRYKDGNIITDSVGNSIAAVPGTLKGDCSICYARPESVELAVQLLDESNFRVDRNTISVRRAKFEQHGEFKGKKIVSESKRKVARLAKLQAIGWDEAQENGRITGGLKGLRIIVLKYVFHPSKNDPEDVYLHNIEREIRNECEQFGHVEKITFYAQNIDGIVLVKFTQPLAASTAIDKYNGRVSMGVPGKTIEATFWDGVTDYSTKDESKAEFETQKRLEDFGKWLDEQELPEEFRLQVEGD